MVVPSSYAVQIIIGGNDVSLNVPYESLQFDDSHRAPSYLSMTVENPDVAIQQGDFVQVIALNLPNTPSIFTGWVRELVTKKRALGTVLDYEIECGDLKERLQKSVIDYGDFSGSDAGIITNLFANVYPNLDAYFDYSSGIDSFASSLNFNVNNESMLDALNRLSDLTGANMRNQRGIDDPASFTFGDVTDAIPLGSTSTIGAEIPSWYSIDPTVNGVGNPSGYALQAAGNLVNTVSAGRSRTLAFFFNFSDSTLGLGSIDSVTFDYYINFDVATSSAQVSVTNARETIETEYTTQIMYLNASAVKNGVWTSVTIGDLQLSPITGYRIAVFLRIDMQGTINGGPANADYDLRIDNVVVNGDMPFQANKDKIIWSQTPEATDFDLDIPNSDEYAFDIADFTGAIDAFNSVTVVGGKAQVAIDWIYDADGASTRINLEAPVKSLAVFKNTGNDVSPTWAAQALGTFGTDELTGAGGTKDVLYDPNNHWLLFNSSPINLTKSVRITGTIEKPIRVRVENIGAGDEVYATVVTNDQITSEEEAIAYGNSILAKKNGLKRITFTTPNPGLKVGQALPILDAVRGINTTLIIKKISTRWIGSSGHALFNVECGDDENDGLDIIVAGIDKKATKSAGGGSFATNTVDQLTDIDGIALFDTSGALLYE